MHFFMAAPRFCKSLMATTSEDAPETVPTIASGVKPPPDNGAMAIIVKTGFETSQGSLVRTMIYSTERVSANNVEALLFILFLLIFAIAASWYVWKEGVKTDRKRSKLLLDLCLDYHQRCTARVAHGIESCRQH